ncbi:hypothetical protein L596_026939 [Steinernema carpocapsae]|uniref:Uncharacterized protein n=1 Tax=Steinernema carpocapsae TaxID=34508 RepID=A0A4U5M2T7_STECR|nr:hypothetical protein L596_026939 [Steinernema carpocapsae]
MMVEEKKLLCADSCEKLRVLRYELDRSVTNSRGDMSSEALWEETIHDWRCLPPTVKIIYVQFFPLDHGAVRASLFEADRPSFEIIFT